MKKRPIPWNDAIDAFVSPDHSTQSAKHIKPLHYYCVDRLVLEGGFRPELISPSPPFAAIPVRGRDGVYELLYDDTNSGTSEQTVLGGLKTKDIDVVVSQRCTGPALAISVKGTLKAFRNLTNRMEEAAGDCTNLHISYPSMVYGFLHFIQALSADETDHNNDIAIDEHSNPVDSIRRYHDAMSRIAGRQDLRNDVSKYEAIALAVIRRDSKTNELMELPSYPLPESKLRFDRFFDQLYRDYDLRYVFAAPKLARETQRVTWIENELTARAAALGFEIRLASCE